MQKNTLWTKDFTIITLGSVVSMIGGSMSGYAMSLLILDYTQTNLYYAIYLVLYTIPSFVMPIFSGAFLDNFSRKKTIYTLDFISASIYLGFYIILKNNWFSFAFFAILTLVIGCINSIYMIAYESFYPLLISESNYSKAYSIASILESFSTITLPLAVVLYKSFGPSILMLINAITFLIAAIMETRITAKEDYLEEKKEQKKDLLRDIKEGISYLKVEKGLLAITIYFFFSFLGAGVANVVALPYYKNNVPNGEYLFSILSIFGVIGRMIGGFIHYRFKVDRKHNFIIALCVYILVSITGAAYLWVPFYYALGLVMLEGFLGVTSYTIRLSSVSKYIPDGMKGRYAGAFSVITMIGLLIGQVLAGAVSDFIDGRIVLAIVDAIIIIAALVFIGGNKKEVSEIYNSEE